MLSRAIALSLPAVYRCHDDRRGEDARGNHRGGDLQVLERELHLRDPSLDQRKERKGLPEPRDPAQAWELAHGPSSLGFFPRRP